MVIHEINPDVILIIILFSSLIIDAFLLCAARKEDLKNKYFLFHKRWGFSKVEIGKIIAALIISNDWIHGSVNKGSLLVIMVTYCVLVFKFGSDYIYFRRNKKIVQL